MNFKRKWLLLVLPMLVLSAALFGAKWKRDHPTPTAFDLEVRKRFLESRNARAVLETKGKFLHTYSLSAREKQEIAEHIFLLQSASISIDMNKTSCSIYWNHDNIGFTWETQEAGAVFDFADPKRPYVYKLHPTTTRFLRSWFAQHSELAQHLALTQRKARLNRDGLFH